MDKTLCAHCEKEISFNACQQGQEVDGQYFALHVGCADLWANELIPVWTVDWDGDLGHTEASLETITAYVTELEPDQNMNISGRRMMKRIEYMNLPDLD